jgi:hypothetical protein
VAAPPPQPPTVAACLAAAVDPQEHAHGGLQETGTAIAPTVATARVRQEWCGSARSPPASGVPGAAPFQGRTPAPRSPFQVAAQGGDIWKRKDGSMGSCAGRCHRCTAGRRGAAGGSGGLQGLHLTGLPPISAVSPRRGLSACKARTPVCVSSWERTLRALSDSNNSSKAAK